MDFIVEKTQTVPRGIRIPVKTSGPRALAIGMCQ